MNNHPSGKVTFLFTDIEGSTRLAQDFSESLHATIDRHDQILRSSVAVNNGHVFQIVGDAFCCSFHDPLDAVKAAVEAQFRISEEEWETGQLKVRMGIHTGNAEWNGSNYMGYLTLARSNRVMSAAHGGQTIITEESAALLKSREGGNISLEMKDGASIAVTLRDLGIRRLKDLIEPMRIFQISVDSLASDFPPLKTLDARPNNLPLQLSSFIGREKELNLLKEQCRITRLATLLGPGGTGKTRLALQAGADLIDEFDNGVWFADLAPHTSGVSVASVLLQALGVEHEPLVSHEDSLLSYMKDKKLLLIIDNCEHLINECAALSERILTLSKNAKLIATSRESLRCKGEFIFKVSSLKHPGIGQKLTPEELLEYESARLFVERALSVNQSFRVNDENVQALTNICAELDGIPLAIELAAARTKVMNVQTISSKLHDRFNLLTAGRRTALPRQQTLRSMIEWSYDLLTEEEKVMWRRLSVFAGRWQLDEAEEICSDELLDAGSIFDHTCELEEKSVVSFSQEEESFKMLETIRQFGKEKLRISGEEAKIGGKHLEFYLKFCNEKAGQLTGPGSFKAIRSLTERYPNIQSALMFAMSSGLYEKANLLGCLLGKFWEVRGMLSEGKQWTRKLVEVSGGLKPDLRAGTLKLHGIFLNMLGENRESEAVLCEAVELFRSSGNETGLSQSLNVLGLVEYDLSKFGQAMDHMAESLELKKKVGTPIGICSSLNSLGILHAKIREYDKAVSYYNEALKIAEDLKDDVYLSILYNNIGEVYACRHQYSSATEFFRKGMDIDVKHGNKNGICISLTNIAQGLISDSEGQDFEEAERLFNEALELSRETGFKQGEAYSHIGLSKLHKAKGETEKCAFHTMKVLDEMAEMCDSIMLLSSVTVMAEVCISKGMLKQAGSILGWISVSSDDRIAKDTETEALIAKLLLQLEESAGKEDADRYYKAGTEMTLQECLCELDNFRQE